MQSKIWKFLKILTPKQMLQKLQKALAEVKAGENIQNDSTKKLTNYIFLVSSKRNF